MINDGKNKKTDDAILLLESAVKFDKDRVLDFVRKSGERFKDGYVKKTLSSGFSKLAKVPEKQLLLRLRKLLSSEGRHSRSGQVFATSLFDDCFSSAIKTITASGFSVVIPKMLWSEV